MITEYPKAHMYLNENQNFRETFDHFKTLQYKQNFKEFNLLKTALNFIFNGYK